LPHAGTPNAAPVDETSPFQRLGFNILLVFLFLVFSRIFDVKFGGLHITGIAYRVVFAIVILSGAFLVALKSNIGKVLLGFTVCFGLAVPFSLWRGGSMDIFLNQWLSFCFVAFLAVAGLISDYGQWFKLFKTVTYALFVFTIIANVWGVSDNGRLFLTQGKFSNPNEMAQALLLGLPLWGVMMVISKSRWGRVFAVGVMGLILVTTFRTGSRGAMIALVTMLLVVFLRASFAGKIKIMLAGVLFLGIALTSMPGSLIARYKTLTDDDVDDVEMSAAVRDSANASTETRKQLLQHSLTFTVQNPLFGVGPGMFEVADDAYMKASGFSKGTWLGTHNSYSQVSSELGIPAFLLFVTAVAMALKGPYSLYKKTRGDPRLEEMGSIALGLHYCLIIYAVTILFEHIAYTIMLPVFGGMVASLVRTAEVEIQRIESIPLPISTSATTLDIDLATRPSSTSRPTIPDGAASGKP